MHLTAPQLATVLAALRYYSQAIVDDLPRSSWINEVATDGGKFKPLNDEEIDQLCEQLNFAPSEPSELSEPSHTPGPWTIRYERHNRYVLCSSPTHPGGFGHFTGWSADGVTTVDQDEANAALITRSPVMHHALRMIAGIAGMEVLSANSEPEDMAANLEEISNAFGEIQGIVRNAIT